MNAQGYDIVGDIHGHASPLKKLLSKLGYFEERGVFTVRAATANDLGSGLLLA